MNSGQNDLLERIRRGDAAAAEELVHRYEPALRRVIRVRLSDPRLRRAMDSADVCQSVFANFFVRAALGEYDVNHSGELTALLLTMARNRLFDHVRRLRTLKRDVHRVQIGESDAIAAVAESAIGPDQIAMNNDLLSAVQKRLTDEEQHLTELRALGLAWEEIAKRVNSTPEAVRKKMTRAVDRAVHELGIEEMKP